RPPRAVRRVPRSARLPARERAMSAWTSFVLLWTLSIVDGGFAGFRASAGRSGRVFKDAYYRAAIRGGMRAGVMLGLFVALVAAVVMLSSEWPRARVEELAGCTERLLMVLGGYATLVLIALGVWSTAEADVRTLASVIILGPFTLIRP